MNVKVFEFSEIAVARVRILRSELRLNLGWEKRLGAFYVVTSKLVTTLAWLSGLCLTDETALKMHCRLAESIQLQ